MPGQDQRLVERAVLVHEYGHLLGLVDCGLPMQTPRADPDLPCHSRNRESVMSALGPSRSADQWLLRDGTGPVWRFDEHDWRDIRAYQAAQVG